MITLDETSVNQIKDSNTEQISILIREYKQARWVNNSKKIGKTDSLSVSFSIEDMERFIEEAKASDADEIKFYFAAFPEDYADIPEYAGRQTIIPVATRANKNIPGTPTSKDIYVSKGGQLKILSGFFPPRLCPPNCVPRTEGGMADLGIDTVDRSDRGTEIV